MSFVKYRVKEVAADFGVTPKEISEIVGKYGEKPKSYTQVMTDAELNVVFDYMTQKNQISSMEQIFAVKATAPKAESKPEPKTENKPAAQPPKAQNNSRPQNNNNNQQPKPQNNQQQAAPKADKPKEPERKRERRVVDTSAVQVNANRFADVDNLVSERVQNYQGG